MVPARKETCICGDDDADPARMRESGVSEIAIHLYVDHGTHHADWFGQWEKVVDLDDDFLTALHKRRKH